MSSLSIKMYHHRNEIDQPPSCLWCTVQYYGIATVALFDHTDPLS